MILLKRADLYADEGRTVAWGYTVNQPRKGHEYYRGVVVGSITLMGDSIYLESKVGERFQLSLCDMNEAALDNAEEALEQFGLQADWDRCKAIVCEHEEKKRRELRGILEPEEIYLELAGNYEVLQAYYRDSSGEIHEADVTVLGKSHFNQVLIREHSKLDFRYNVRGMELEPSRWSGALKAVKILAVGESFRLKGKSDYIRCGVGEITVITPEEFDGEVMSSFYEDAWEHLDV